LNEWTAAGNVRGLFGEEGKQAVSAGFSGTALPTAEPATPPVAANETVANANSTDAQSSQSAVRIAPSKHARHPIEALLDFSRARFNQKFIDAITKIFRIVGLNGLLLAMVLVILFALSCGLKTHQTGIIVAAIGMVLLLVVLHYVAGRFMVGIEQLHRSSQGKIASTVVLDCFALLSPVLAVGVLLMTIVSTLTTGFLVGIVLGVIGAVLCVYFGCLALNPSAVEIQVVPETKASEEILGLLSFIFNSLLTSAPIWFGAGVTGGLIVLLNACILIAVGGKSGMEEINSTLLATNGCMVLIFATLIPAAAYLAFLIWRLLVDLVLAVLSIPGAGLRNSQDADGKQESSAPTKDNPA
jgi:hypothetical protein